MTTTPKYLLNPTDEQRSVIFNLADAINMTVFSDTRKGIYKDDYPNLKVNFSLDTTNNIVGNATELGNFKEGEVVSFKDMVKAMLEYEGISRKVRLNSSYTAIILDDGTLKVGCQVFKKDAIEKLIEAYNKFK